MANSTIDLHALSTLLNDDDEIVPDSESDANSDINLSDEQSEEGSEGSGGSEDTNGDNGDDIDEFLPDYVPMWVERDFERMHVNAFTGTGGPVFPDEFDRRQATPKDYVSLFFTTALMGTILRNSNEYHSWLVAVRRRRKPDYVDHNWQDISMEHLQAYFGLNVLFGINELSSYPMYWSNDPFVGNAGVKSVMTLKSYEKINQYLHVSDRENEPIRGDPNYDKLFKIRPVIDVLSQQCLAVCKPYENQCIDEAMLGTKARCEYQQFMKDKPIRRGVKLYLRCDSISGFMHQFEVYLGKKHEVASSGLGTYFDVVDRLSKEIRGKNHKLYYDNLYTSIPLALHMLQNKIYTCGTVRAGRKFVPSCIKNPPGLQRGEHKTVQDALCPELTLTTWADTKNVAFASTMSNPFEVKSARRRVGGVVTNVPQPAIAFDYNACFAGVDRYDYLRSAWPIGRASLKLWKYFLWFFYNCAVTNAWILYKQTSTRNIQAYSHMRFRLELAQGLIAGYTESFSNRRNIAPANVVTPANLHLHVNVHRRGKRPRCCYAHRRYKPDGKAKKETVYWCSVCHVNLCKDCHVMFHSQ